MIKLQLTYFPLAFECLPRRKSGYGSLVPTAMPYLPCFSITSIRTWRTEARITVIAPSGPKGRARFILAALRQSSGATGNGHVHPRPPAKVPAGKKRGRPEGQPL